MKKDVNEEKERRRPKNKNNRKLFWNKIADQNVKRCFSASMVVAIVSSVVLILANTVFFNDKLVSFVLPGAFYAVSCGAFAVLGYRLIGLGHKESYGSFCFVFAFFTITYASFMTTISLRVSGSFFFYCVGIIFVAYVLYTTMTQYIIVSCYELLCLLVAVLIAAGAGYKIEYSQLVALVAAHIFSFTLSRDGYKMKSELLRIEFRADKEIRKAERDPLTGLINRRGLEHEIAPIWKVCVRQSDIVGIVIIDIDNFKIYNDSFGHVQGDVCLKRVASSIAATVGEQGFASRIGGEEFLIFLYGMDADEMIELAEKVREDVQNMAIPHATSKGAVVTISAGLDIETASGEISFTGLYGRADKLLYKAKQTGKNRVICNRGFDSGYATAGGRY